MQGLCVHKYRRAPYGTGRFWSALKEALEAFLSVADSQHPLVERFGAAIAADHGLAPDVATSDPAALWRAMRTMLHDRLGPKVEMRRWFTIAVADDGLDKRWHTMLLALVVDLALSGQDAWELAQKTVPV
eukprot:15096095-Alexandrium_andersonii.AAC.1